MSTPTSRCCSPLTADDNPDDVRIFNFRRDDERTGIAFWWSGGVYGESACWIKAGKRGFVSLDESL